MPGEPRAPFNEAKMRILLVTILKSRMIRSVRYEDDCLFRFFSLYESHKYTFEAKCGPSNRTGSRWRRAGRIAGSARGPGPKSGLQKRSNFGESLRRDCRSISRSTPTILASTLIQVYPSFDSSFNYQRVMPIPDSQTLRKLPKDFVWGYATGE